ncbi:VTT domain-containing protein [Bacillus sp. FJAT-49736]|uniref:VTT domain-containing protein n=1 Tax=Bacillus sp. FJAT-49736 TaxID=2833582 RepID=UPI001BCA34B6|nr:VTT domain-containing protein [Bacillus sp. FJAT-49736]MBS4174076.1 VTT domain-containing protein [Bacillus sp. FJAT-49736]
MNLLIHLIDQYGYIVLFFSLMLELIIVPIPNEILMSYVGYLVYQGKMNLFLTILFGGLGGIIGVTISYWIGYKLGAPFFNKYGSKIHMGPDKIEKMGQWNRKYGKRLLLFSYFIPGVRHITSIFSGITRISFKQYAIFAYIGVFLWVGTFVTLGKIFGPKWEQFHQQAKIYVIIGCVLIGIIYLLYFLIKTNKEKIKQNLILLFVYTFKRFNSFLKIKLLIFFITVIFIALFSLMISVIQGFIANEFQQFNDIANTVVQYVFNQNWTHLMKWFSGLTSWKSLLVVGILTVIWIAFKGKNKLLEYQYYVIGIIGGILLSKGLPLLFNMITKGKLVSKNFPSEETLLSIVIFAYFMYVVVRHSKNSLLNTFIVSLEILILLVITASNIYLGYQHPSDLVAGYTFGAVWICLVILLIELSRLLNLIKQSSPAK